MPNQADTITILCSGITLGVYVPGLIVNGQLRARGFSTDMVVLESLFYPEQCARIQGLRMSYHQNFALALMGQKLARTNLDASLEEARISALLATWRNEGRKRFIVFSGFWLPILERYLQNSDFPQSTIDLCHMDAVPAASWKLADIDHPGSRHLWFFSWERKYISCYLRISADTPIRFLERSDRFLIHGGGWGIGTYRDKIPQLEEYGLKLNVIAYTLDDIQGRNVGRRYYLLDPDWKSWEKNESGGYEFPPIAEARADQKIEFRNNPLFPEVYRLIRQSRAIISKPGGATLMDSFSSATPIVFLEPFGECEAKNALLWEYFGFGISYQKWMKANCSLKVLEDLHNNLQEARAQVPDYVEAYHATEN